MITIIFFRVLCKHFTKTTHGPTNNTDSSPDPTTVAILKEEELVLHDYICISSD